MSGTIENREPFLKKIAEQLNHQPGEKPPARIWKHRPQEETYQDDTADQLVAMMKKACASIHTNVYETSRAELAGQLDKIIIDYGAGEVIATHDPRFASFGLQAVLQKHHAYIWDYTAGRKNIDQAAKSRIGLSVCDVMLAESASAGLFNDKDKARSVSLLPEISIVIVPKSCIVPRLTQAMERIEDRVQKGENIASYINFISGPSNSADIEMRLVVGVHGPIKVSYIIVSDC